MRTFKKIGVLASGGDAPGMNAALRAVTNAAIAKGIEVIGIYGGYSGLINDKVKPLTGRDTANIIYESGTFMYSDRCLEFKTEEGMKKAVDTCRKLGIDGIVAIGGDGTFRGATDLSAHGIATIGIPGTIDNDITTTDDTIGFDTAKNTIVTMCDCLRSTCESHARCNVIKVMGRNAGYIGLEAAAASAAVGVAVKEVPFDEDALLEKMKKLRAAGQRSFIVVVSEGLDDYAEKLRYTIEEKTGIETRYVSPEHIVRGGIPTCADRLLATEMGYFAVEKLLEGMSDVVICKRAGALTTMNIKFALITDRMYKNTLKPGDLDAFTPEQVAEMKKLCEERAEYFVRMTKMINDLAV